MKALVQSWLVAGAFLCATVPTGAQPPAGALAIDERQGDQYGWAVDYETPAAARAAAMSKCGAGCAVVLTFNRCGAYAADQDTDSTAVGWAESYAAADGARQAALTECRARGGSGCIVRVWGCNGQVVEEGLGLDQAVRRQIQEGLEAAGFDPGVADGVFGPRTRAAIRSWQSSRGGRTTGYLDARQVEALRDRGRSEPPATASPTPASDVCRPAVMLLLVAGLLPAAAQRDAPPTAEDGWRLAAKLARIIDRGSRDADRRQTVVLLEREVNAYLRFQAVSQLPAGVTEPRITMTRDGRVAARARIDLDAVAAGRERSALDPLSYLRGSLPVAASGVLEAHGGIGRIQIESVTVADLPVPAFVLDVLVRFHSRSEAYPLGFDLADPFELPYRIREIHVAAGEAVVVQ